MKAIIVLFFVLTARRSAFAMSRYPHPMRVKVSKPPASMHLVNPFAAPTLTPIAVLRGIAITALVVGVMGCNVATPPMAVDAGVVDAGIDAAPGTGPEHAGPITPTDPSLQQIRVRPMCDRLAGQNPPPACVLACSVGIDNPNLPTDFENAGYLKPGECADYACKLLGGGALLFGVCAP